MAGVRRLALIDADTGEVVAEWPRRKIKKIKNTNGDTPELLAALAVVLVGLLLVVITE